MTSHAKPTRIRRPDEPVVAGYCPYCGVDIAEPARAAFHTPSNCREALYVVLCEMESRIDEMDEVAQAAALDNLQLITELDNLREAYRQTGKRLDRERVRVAELMDRLESAGLSLPSFPSGEHKRGGEE